MDDVGDCETQARKHQGKRPGGHRYRFPGGPGRDPHGAHREPDRALQDPREGQPFAARPLDDGQQAPLASRLSPQGRRSALSRSYREARSSQINVGAAPPGPLRISGLRNSAAPDWVIWAQTHRAEARFIGRPPHRAAGEKEKQMFNMKKVAIEWGGKTLTLETGRVARQADGARRQRTRLN